MSSELLLQWMTQYPKKIISEQVINKACINIERTNGHEINSVSKIRRKYINPLLEYGHIEYANQQNSAYTVSPPTMLHINNSYSIFCGARTENDISNWKKLYNYTLEDSGFSTCWSDELLQNKDFSDLNISNINVNDVLKKLPILKTEHIGQEITDISINKLKRFNPISGKWEISNKLHTGVYRERDDLPASVQSWFWHEKNKSGDSIFVELYSYELTSIALCLSSILENKLGLFYNYNSLNITLPKGVFLPLMIKRPLTWLNVGSGEKNKPFLFKNINNSTAQEISRIFNVKLKGN